jgi:hypothetical protein
MTKPSEQRGGTRAGDDEARDKGAWVGSAKDGVVPAELGGSDAPRERSPEEGRTTGSEEPATETGIDLTAGDGADAVTHGGPEPPEDVEPDLKNAAGAPRQVDR